ncbi:MAG: hypothetical protein ACI9EW_002528 [Cellvibrionaceae bacterium]
MKQLESFAQEGKLFEPNLMMSEDVTAKSDPSYYSSPGYPISSDPNSEGEGKIADFNNDGLLDVIYSGGSNLKIYFQLSSEGFSVPTTVANNFESWNLGDFNNDTMTDIAITVFDYETSTVVYQFLLQDKDGEFKMQTTLSARDSSPSQRFMTIDLNQDGFDDLVAISDEFLYNHAFQWPVLISDGLGNYVEDIWANKDIDDSLSNSITPRYLITRLNTNSPESIVYHWESEDTEADELRFKYTIKINNIENNTITNTHTIELRMDSEQSMRSNGTLEFHDLNQDGLTDIFLDVNFDEYNLADDYWWPRSQVAVWTQIEGGRFSGPIFLTGSRKKINGMAFADVNQDGVEDLITLNDYSYSMYSEMNLSIYFFDKTGKLITRKDKDGLEYSTRDSYRPFVVKDFNGDQFPDVLVGNLLFDHNQLIYQIFLPTTFYKYVNYQSLYDDFSNPNSG